MSGMFCEFVKEVLIIDPKSELDYFVAREDMREQAERTRQIKREHQKTMEKYRKMNKDKQRSRRKKSG